MIYISTFFLRKVDRTCNERPSIVFYQGFHSFIKKAALILVSSNTLMCVCCIVFVQDVEFHFIWKWPSSRILALSFIRGSAVLLRKWHWFYWVQMHWCTSAVLSFYRVFSSSAYESDHLSVFHSRYITDRVRAGDRSKVILGHYFLPPQDIVARKYQRCREIIYSLLTRMLPGSQDSSLVERQTGDQKVASSSPGRSGGRIFYSRVNFPWWLTQCPLRPVLPQWYVKDPDHARLNLIFLFHQCYHFQ